jgi:hypothetical protein
VGKIIVRLSGGLGNQMHQYAFGIYLQKLTSYELLIDESFLQLNADRLNITKRNFELHQFNVKKTNYSGILSNYYLNLILKRFSLLRLLLLKIFGVKNLVNNAIDLFELKNCKIIYVDSVFGTVSQYMHVRREINESFALNINYQKLKKEVNCTIVKQNSIAIHVRRTDYLKPDSIHAVLDIDYYKKAIGLMLKKVSNPTIYLFGDDEEWIKNNLLALLPQAQFINQKGGNAALFDFLAIGYCENIITSNSTYAWWAAFLSTNSEVCIIAPNIWLKNVPINRNEIYLSDWNII